MFGVDGSKLIVLLIIAAFLLGPTRLTTASAWLGRTVRQLRDLTDRAKDRAKDELGEDFDDWRSLDPRRYDPRRIIADALLAPPEVAPVPEPRAALPSATTTRAVERGPEAPVEPDVRPSQDADPVVGVESS